MEKVESVNLQAVKDIECASKQVTFRAKHDNIESDDKGMRKSTKIMIGATILAATTAIGIIAHHKIKAGKATKELLRDVAYRKGCITRLFNDTGCEEQVAKRLAEIEKLPLPEQVKALQGLEQTHTNIQKIQSFEKEGGLYLRRGMSDYPPEVKNAIKEGRWLEAGELYEKYVQTLPNTFRTGTTGNTVEETITNVFGKDSKIKPHTYDLSQEGEYIGTMRNFGGFEYSYASKEGVIYEDVSAVPKALFNSMSNHNNGLSRLPINDSFVIQHGVSEGRYVTLIVGPKGEMPMSLGLVSKGKNITSAQKDLLSLAEHPEKFNASYIDALTLRNSVNGVAGDYGIVNLDYDLAYSIIQSMARV